MKKNKYWINLIGGVFCFFFLALISFHSNVYSASSDYFDTVQKAYIGYYQRAADPAGLIYWAGRLSDSGGNLSAIIEAFANSQESRDLYGTINSSTIGNVVDSIYNALFNRPAEPAGKEFYVNGFNAGTFTAATIMLNVLYGAQNQDLESVNHKLAVTNLFTRTIDPELDGTNFQVTYAGEADAILGRSFLSTVTWDPATVPIQDETSAYMRSYIANPGDPILSQGMSMADLSGIWEINGVESPEPWWHRGSLTIGSDGSFSGMISGSDGSTTPISGTFSITSGGIIHATAAGIPSSFRCTMDMGKSVVACTELDGDDTIMTIFTKKAASYSLSDLSGSWEMNDCSSSDTWWSRGTMVIGSDGSFSAMVNDSEGSTDLLSGTVSLTTDGILRPTGPGIPSSVRCAVDSGKSVMACTSTSSGGNTGMQIFTKKAESYSLSDLSGLWEMNLFTSSIPWWQRGSLAIGLDGSFSGIIKGSDGSIDPVSETFSITQDGVITATGGDIPSSFRCAMDSGKSVAACTFTDSDGYTNMMLLTKKIVP